MKGRTPHEVAKELKIQPPTLRKYSLLFEKEGILFKRNQNNSRIYSDTEFVALQEVVTATKNGGETLENAVRKASEQLKGSVDITHDNTVTEQPLQRYNDDITGVMLEEIKSLRKEIRERDLLFVEALEKMQAKIDRMESQQKLLLEPEEEEPVHEAKPESKPAEKKGLFSRFFKK